ncbi:MAG: hypothetical protein KDC71_21200 [Acidobacteria bacterium]|nr:hypothetical protein [Acidobacteriota bacterium]
MIPITTNATHHLKMAGIHDATLHAFSFTLDKHFEITLHHSDSGINHILFEGVSHIGFQNVVQGLLVLNIFAFPLSQLDQLLPQQKHAYFEILMGNALDSFEIDRLIEQNQSDERTKLVAIESSYGGDICLLCRNLWHR